MRAQIREDGILQIDPSSNQEGLDVDNWVNEFGERERRACADEEDGVEELDFH